VEIRILIFHYIIKLKTGIEYSDVCLVRGNEVCFEKYESANKNPITANKNAKVANENSKSAI